MLGQDKPAPVSVVGDQTPVGMLKTSIPQGGKTVKGNHLTDKRKAPAKPKVPPAVLARFESLYLHTKRPFAMQMPDGGCPVYDRVLSDREIVRHLTGKASIACYPEFRRQADGKRFTRWGSFDIDLLTVPPNEKVGREWLKATAIVPKMQAALLAMGVDPTRLYVYETGYKGFRAELHMDKPVGVDTWVKFFDLVMTCGQEGERLCDIDDVVIESRPNKQGDHVRLPLGVHRVSGNRSWFLDPVNLEPVKTLNYILSMEEVSGESIRAAVLRARRSKFDRPMRQGTTTTNGEAKTAERAYLDDLLNGYLPRLGTRRYYFPRLGARLKELGHSREEAERVLVSWCERQKTAGLIDATRTRWLRDLRSTLDRVYTGKFKLPAERRTATVTEDDARLLAMITKPLARMVYAYMLRYGRSMAKSDGTFYVGMAQIAQAVYGHGRGLTPKEVAERKGHISKAVRELLSLGVLEKPTEMQSPQWDHAAVYRFPLVSRPNPRTFEMCTQATTCPNCPFVVMAQTLTDAEVKRMLTRHTYDCYRTSLAEEAPCLRR